ncbi:hypothetical protein THAOC_22634 [Thalassiosira oceanica]|uniref:Uncharacterized protein n=1 Tax=Thalassiosira oceanica TaxID=159749 RepID=K0RU12_THAOC|nr:hypothetical protein THAOC_22634 [Thalassiosira oceanica]|eukprot:EJK57333.1 hypothetical protein THAOC_22634 [Thalassiosira oceanica]
MMRVLTSIALTFTLYGYADAAGCHPSFDGRTSYVAGDIPGGADDRVLNHDGDNRGAQLQVRERPEQRVLQHGRLRADGEVLKPCVEEGIFRVLGQVGLP